MTRLSRNITDLWPFLFTRESFRIRYLYMSHWDVCISMWCSRCLWWPPTVTLAHALRNPLWSPLGGPKQLLKASGVKLVSDTLREMKTCAMLLAALLLPSIQAGELARFCFHFIDLHSLSELKTLDVLKYKQLIPSVCQSVIGFYQSLW